MSSESSSVDLWDEFVQFAYSKKLEHKHLFPDDLDIKTLEQMLSFHFHHGNLYMAKHEGQWSFGVMRPIKDPMVPDFNWEQPEGDYLLLDFLYCKSKKVCLALWDKFCGTSPRPKAIVFYRKGKPKVMTKEMVLRFFSPIFSK